jgi:hypothetical protein
VRFVQLAARNGLTINHIPMRMQDVYAGSGGILLANRASCDRPPAISAAAPTDSSISARMLKHLS